MKNENQEFFSVSKINKYYFDNKIYNFESII